MQSSNQIQKSRNQNPNIPKGETQEETLRETLENITDRQLTESVYHGTNWQTWGRTKTINTYTNGRMRNRWGEWGRKMTGEVIQRQNTKEELKSKKRHTRAWFQNNTGKKPNKSRDPDNNCLCLGVLSLGWKKFFLSVLESVVLCLKWTRIWCLLKILQSFSVVPAA